MMTFKTRDTKVNQLPAVKLYETESLFTYSVPSESIEIPMKDKFFVFAIH